MAIAIKHAFTSLKGDGTDATFVQPSSWNANHAFTSATGVVLGRLSAGAGNVEEISLSTQGAAILAAADASSYGFVTGDIKNTFNEVPPAGWIALAGTIGNAASGATNRANADVQALFVLLYTKVLDAYFPVSGGRTGNAVNDFNAGKTLSLANANGRVLANAYGAFSVGQVFGEATHTLTTAELPAHQHYVSGYTGDDSPDHTHSYTYSYVTGGYGIGNGGNNGVSATATSTSGASARHQHAINFYSQFTGSTNAHNNYQPSMAVIFLVKL